MFKRQYRLPSGTRIASQSTLSTPLFFLKTEANHLSLSRFGFVVSKKVDKRAVVRNRTRRVLRSVVEDLFPQIKPGFNVLFILREPIEKKTEELEKEVTQVFTKADLLNK
jgi:ribonuclease P protein component